MANTINQPSSNPTNKLTAAIIGAAGISVLRVVVRVKFPEWADDAMFDSLTPLVIGMAGWYTPDRPNITVITQDSDSGQ